MTMNFFLVISVRNAVDLIVLHSGLYSLTYRQTMNTMLYIKHSKQCFKVT